MKLFDEISEHGIIICRENKPLKINRKNGSLTIEWERLVLTGYVWHWLVFIRSFCEPHNVDREAAQILLPKGIVSSPSYSNIPVEN